eukprot:TRINITY_DN35560_c0_g1_i1.p1 TRINITY_DN35560_c0_g1~~TRINITY_DN35560_c0_g1_i1.p1  ORF type:complete len:267 (+),score=78.42 TRINITY_DN35560_c0_g1_i1:55-855(+)
METPSPAPKRAGNDLAVDEKQTGEETTPAPVAKKRRMGARDKAAQAVATEADELEEQAQEWEKKALEAAAEAEDATKRAQRLSEQAASIKAKAEQAREAASEAKTRADRAKLEATKEGRAALKVQDKADKKAAKEADQAQKLKEKHEAAASRSIIKNIGDSIKASMVISKRGGMWSVPPGSLSFRNIPYSTFQELFSRGRCAFTPANYCESDPTISVVTKDAASIFGATKVRGGSMYATFVISSMRVTYIPAQKQLSIAYNTDYGF